MSLSSLVANERLILVSLDGLKSLGDQSGLRGSDPGRSSPVPDVWLLWCWSRFILLPVHEPEAAQHEAAAWFTLKGCSQSSDSLACVCQWRRWQERPDQTGFLKDGF